MRLMSKLLGRQERATQSPVATPPCPHTTMTPRWDRAEDMGHLERATAFHCESCGETFAAEEAASLQATEAQRLQKVLPSE